MSEQLYNLLSKVFNIPISSINDESNPKSISSWTSFNGYVLLDSLETTFKIKFTLDEVLDVKNVADIKRHLKNHGVQFE